MNDIEFPLLWDSTTLAALRACKHRLYRGTLQHWSRPGHSIHLIAGAAYARGLEVANLAFLRGDDDALSQGLNALEIAYGDADSQGTNKTLPRMLDALSFYFDNYPFQPKEIIELAGKPAVEWSFALPMSINHPITDEPLIFCGRADTIVNYANGIYIRDDKTTSQLGASWSKQWSLRGQFLGYSWALRQLGVKNNGVIVRGVSILKTKFETQQVIIHIPEWLSNEWYQATLTEIAHAKQLFLRESTINPEIHWVKNFSEACNEYGGCQFKQTCTLRNPDEWFQQYFVKRIWNPLTREENV